MFFLLQKLYFKMNYYKAANISEKNKRINAIGQITNLPETSSLKKILKTGETYHKPMPPPQEGDWLYSHKEDGQTFSQFMSGGLIRPSKNKIIYINPLQDMSQTFLDNCLLYCQSFFYPLKIKLIKISNLKSLHIESRINEYTNKIQYNASQINQKMANYVPNDAHCVLSILLDDLYPKPSWNFVFGLANYYQKVCVFSFARFDPSFFGETRPNNFENYLLYRSCNTLVHEICHTFGLSHCIYYQCLMNGSNNLEEQLKRPLIECPVCLRKLYEVIKFDCKERYIKLKDICKLFGGYFDDNYKWYENRILSLD